MTHRDLIFFDLDDTLYPSHNGLWQAMKARMNRYMHEKLGIPLDEIPRLREFYFREYGTTLRGLQHFYPVDMADYLAYVHDVPLEQYIQPDPALREMLAALPLERWILTNADKPHARRVLRVLGVEDQFAGIVDTVDMYPYCKPQPEGFAAALQRVGREAAACILADDLPTTTRAARQLGMFTILVGEHHPPDSPDADLVIPQIYDLLPALQSASLL